MVVKYQAQWFPTNRRKTIMRIIKKMLTLESSQPKEVGPLF